MNIAIILAAGGGARFESETPKQFVEIGNKKIIINKILVLIMLKSEYNVFSLNITNPFCRAYHHQHQQLRRLQCTYRRHLILLQAQQYSPHKQQ